MKANTFLLLLLLPLFLPGQSDECARYDDLIGKAQQALQAEDYQTALFQLQAAKTGCYRTSTQAEELIEKLFETIALPLLFPTANPSLSRMRIATTTSSARTVDTWHFLPGKPAEVKPGASGHINGRTAFLPSEAM